MVNHTSLVTVERYAGLCGVKNGAIHQRIKKHAIIPIVISKIEFIDINRYPPQKRVLLKKNHQSSFDNYIKIEEDEVINVRNLITVKHYAKLLEIRPDNIYEDIIRKNINCSIIAGIIFINIEKHPLNQYKYIRKLKKKRNI